MLDLLSSLLHEVKSCVKQAEMIRCPTICSNRGKILNLDNISKFKIKIFSIFMFGKCKLIVRSVKSFFFLTIV